MEMRKIDVSELKDNFFESIGKEWMLVTSGTAGRFNTMTASWGCVGWLWNKPVAIIFIRPERLTHEFIEKEEKLTLSFLGQGADMRSVYNVCGSQSGRDIDKVAETGLEPLVTECGCVTFKQSRLTLECAKLYKDSMNPERFMDSSTDKWYGDGKGGYHDFYVLEILNVYVCDKS